MFTFPFIQKDVLSSLLWIDFGVMLEKQTNDLLPGTPLLLDPTLKPLFTPVLC